MTSFRQRSISNFLLRLFSLCDSTIRYTCELLLHQVWEWGLPRSETSEHIQGSMLLYWNARSRLGKPLWNLPHPRRGCVRFLSHRHKHMQGNTAQCALLIYFLHLMSPEGYDRLCTNKGYQNGRDDQPKGLCSTDTRSSVSCFIPAK